LRDASKTPLERREDGLYKVTGKEPGTDIEGGSNFITLSPRTLEGSNVNALEVMIDEECSTVIARRQPAAKDLRMIMTVVKTITDLERIGDEAAKIARMTISLYSSDRPVVPRTTEIQHVAEIAVGMLRNALDSFARLDLSVAAKVVRQDEQVDSAFKAILRQLITFMMEDPRTISHALDILFIAKSIERIGDHSKNMSEYVVYLVKGKDVRHTSVEAVEREALG
jgi:phosphate transport system protein